MLVSNEFTTMTTSELAIVTKVVFPLRVLRLLFLTGGIHLVHGVRNHRKVSLKLSLVEVGGEIALCSFKTWRPRKRRRC